MAVLAVCVAWKAVLVLVLVLVEGVGLRRTIGATFFPPRPLTTCTAVAGGTEI